MAATTIPLTAGHTTIPKPAVGRPMPVTAADSQAPDLWPAVATLARRAPAVRAPVAAQPATQEPAVAPAAAVVEKAVAVTAPRPKTAD